MVKAMKMSSFYFMVEVCLGAMFDSSDFIDYLNKWAFPEQQSKEVKGLGCYDYEIPEEYKSYPKYNF